MAKKPQRDKKGLLTVEGSVIAILTLLVIIANKEPTVILLVLLACSVLSVHAMYQTPWIEEAPVNERNSRVASSIVVACVAFSLLGIILWPSPSTLRLYPARVIPPGHMSDNIPAVSLGFANDGDSAIIEARWGGVVKVSGTKLWSWEIDSLYTRAVANTDHRPVTHNMVLPGVRDGIFDISDVEITDTDFDDMMHNRKYIYVVGIAKYRDKRTPFWYHGVTAICQYYKGSNMATNACEGHNETFTELGRLR